MSVMETGCWWMAGSCWVQQVGPCMRCLLRRHLTSTDAMSDENSFVSRLARLILLASCGQTGSTTTAQQRVLRQCPQPLVQGLPGDHRQLTCFTWVILASRLPSWTFCLSCQPQFSWPSSSMMLRLTFDSHHTQKRLLDRELTHASSLSGLNCRMSLDAA